MIQFVSFVGNFPPNVTVDDDVFTVTVGVENIHTFTVTDPDGFTVTISGGTPQGGLLFDEGDGIYSFRWTPETTPTDALSFMVEDAMGAITLHSPILHVCTCYNGGDCTVEGLSATNQLIQNLTCICTEG